MQKNHTHNPNRVHKPINHDKLPQITTNSSSMNNRLPLAWTEKRSTTNHRQNCPFRPWRQCQCHFGRGSETLFSWYSQSPCFADKREEKKGDECPSPAGSIQLRVEHVGSLSEAVFHKNAKSLVHRGSAQFFNITAESESARVAI